MSLKYVMVHLDQGERTRVRLEMAKKLARRHGARLQGVFAQRAPAQQVGVVASWPSPAYVAARDANRAMFEEATGDLPGAEWHDINRGSDAEIVRHVVNLARYADLVVLGQHDDRTRAETPDELVIETVLDSGRPVLVVPYAGCYEDVGQHPMIAWNDAREAAHALAGALPLIEGCEEAMILSFAARRDHADASCDGVAANLGAHGIKSRTEVMLVEDFGIMDMLLNRVTDRGADLLVMGAHGHIGFPFVSRGGGTRYILRHMTVPVLMAN